MTAFRATLKQGTLLLFLLLGACRSLKPVTGGEVDPDIPVARIIKNHYARQSDFQTLRGSIKIDYTKGKKSQGVNVNLRMEKDKAIWLTAPFGVVKAYITPEKVSFYNKLEETYFEGDYTYLSALLGTELDFDRVQSLILGHAVFDLRKEAYTSTLAQNTYQLKPKEAGVQFKTVFWLEPKHFKIASQEVSQPEEHRQWRADYTYQRISEQIFPDKLQMTATGRGDTTAIALRFQHLELNSPLNFPYKIPEGFTRITVK